MTTFPPGRPADNTLTLKAGEVRFDITTSTARPGSLFRQFTLDVAGLRSGTPKTPPIPAPDISPVVSVPAPG